MTQRLLGTLVLGLNERLNRNIEMNSLNELPNAKINCEHKWVE